MEIFIWHKTKNGDANSIPALIIVIAIIFILGGDVGLYAHFTASELETIYVIISGTLLTVGILLFIFVLSRVKQLKTLKILQQKSTSIFNNNFCKSKIF